jgi:hypothetical protein
VIKVHDLTSIANVAYQASFTGKNIIAYMLSLVFGQSQDLPAVKRILSHHFCAYGKKNFVTKISLFLLLAPL